MEKKFRLPREEIKPVAEGHGGCIASDKITIDGHPVRFMYREEPDYDWDGGWRFLSGLEDDDYMDDSQKHGAYDVNTIANYDPTIVPLLDSAIGSAFEKRPESGVFVEVKDWSPPDD
ncbi:DUF2185 domain-containing protein [Rhizobium herbae]